MSSRDPHDPGAPGDATPAGPDGSPPSVGWWDATAAAALALIILGWLWPYVLRGTSWEGTDNFLLGRPNTQYALERWKEGQVPLWNPYSALGTSHLAQATAPFDPFNALGLFSPADATMLTIALQLWLAAIGAYVLVRRLACGRRSALVGAIAYVAASWSINLIETRIYAAGLVWLPWTLAGVLHALRSSGARAIVWPATCLSLGMLGGYPHLWPMLVGTTALVALVPVGGLCAPVSLRGRLAVTAGVLGLSFLQAALYTLPCVEAFTRSSRGQLSVPVGGNPSQTEALVELVLSGLAFNFGPVGFGFGLLPPAFLLCLLTWTRGARHPSARLGLLLATAAAAVLIEPGRSLVRVVLGPTGPLGRFGLIWAMGACLLTAAGMETLLTRTDEGRPRSEARTGAVVRGYLVLVCLSLAYVALVPGLSIFGQPAPAYLVVALLQFDLHGTAPALVALATAGTAVAAVRTHGRDPASLRLFGVAVLALATVAHVRFGVRARHDCPPVEDLLSAVLDRPLDGPSPARSLMELCASVDRRGPRGELDPYRVAPLALGLPYDERSRGGINGVGSRIPLFYNLQGLRRILSPSYYGTFLNRETAEFLHTLTLGHRQAHGCNMAMVSSLHPVLLKLAGIRYLLSFDPVPDAGSAGLSQVATVGPVRWAAPGSTATTETIRVYEYRDRIPRAFIVTRVRPTRTADERLALLCDPHFDPRESCLVEPQDVDTVSDLVSAASSGRSTAAVDVIAYEPERVTIRAQVDRTSVLVLTDAFERGWRATVDGRQTRVLRVDHCFRGVVLPAGRHTIEFVYDPWSFRAGLCLTAIGLVLSLAMLSGARVWWPTVRVKAGVSRA